MTETCCSRFSPILPQCHLLLVIMSLPLCLIYWVYGNPNDIQNEHYREPLYNPFIRKQLWETFETVSTRVESNLSGIQFNNPQITESSQGASFSALDEAKDSEVKWTISNYGHFNGQMRDHETWFRTFFEHLYLKVARLLTLSQACKTGAWLVLERNKKH